MAGTPLSSATTSPRTDPADIQGLVRSGYDKTLPEACYLLLRVTDAVAARRWLAEAPITVRRGSGPPRRHGASGRADGSGCARSALPTR